MHWPWLHAPSLLNERTCARNRCIGLDSDISSNACTCAFLLPSKNSIYHHILRISHEHSSARVLFFQYVKRLPRIAALVLALAHTHPVFRMNTRVHGIAALVLDSTMHALYFKEFYISLHSTNPHERVLNIQFYTSESIEQSIHDIYNTRTVAQ
jgi:hypothetical protein